MPTLLTPNARPAPRDFAGPLTRLAEEASALAQALLSPGKIIDEVEQMHALQVEADSVEASDPVRAEALRERASRIGLR